MRLRTSYGEIELIFMEKNYKTFKCIRCGKEHPYLFNIWRHPASITDGRIQFRYCGKTHTPDLTKPIVVDELPRDARIYPCHFAEIVWHSILDKPSINLLAMAARVDELEVRIHAIRRMCESGCTLQDIVGVCEEILPENGEEKNERIP